MIALGIVDGKDELKSCGLVMYILFVFSRDLLKVFINPKNII